MQMYVFFVCSITNYNDHEEGKEEIEANYNPH